jgi:2-hydroxycyclohexanecarboxyl-CoA dehydrogenase
MNAAGAFAGQFHGKVVLATGSTSGIGLATAELLAAAGAHAVILNGRNEESGRAAVARVHAANAACEVMFAGGDLRGIESATRVCGHALDAHGRIDIFIHAAGGDVSPALFTEIAPRDYRSLIDSHFTSLVNCASVVVPAMITRGAGAIVVLASDAGKVATPGESLTGSLMAAKVMYVRTLALELARHQIRVNCITPSLVTDTKAYERVIASEHGKRIFERAAARAKLGVPNPRDIAPLAAFLASPLASHITGQAISVNGGISAA